MKNKILAFILTFALAFGSCSLNIFAAGMSIYPEQSNYEFEENQIGEKFIVDFMLDGNDGYNNSTFRVKYNPKVVRMVRNETSDIENDGFIVYELRKGVTRRLFANDEIAAQFSQIPSKRDEYGDYEGLADGKKTAAEIGIVKFGQIVSNLLGRTYDIEENGIFIRLTFEVVGHGETDIEIADAGSSIIIYATGSQEKSVDLVPAHVKVDGVVEEEQTNSVQLGSKDEDSTETTTSSQSSGKNESSTETTTTSEKSTESTTNDSEGNSSNNSKDNSSNSDRRNNNNNRSDDDDNGNGENDENSTDKNTDNGNSETAQAIAFSDIANYPWAQKAINQLAGDKIVNGIGNGKFAPEANVKRADFLIMLMNALNINQDNGESGFSDVDNSKYYAKAVSAAKTLGIAAGDDKGNFRPEEFISRQDMMVLAYRALEAADYKIETEDNQALDKFEDKAVVSEYAKKALNAMVSKKIVNGTGNNIEPKDNTTRAQAAVIIYNICEFIK